MFYCSFDDVLYNTLLSGQDTGQDRSGQVTTPIKTEKPLRLFWSNFFFSECIKTMYMKCAIPNAMSCMYPTLDVVLQKRRRGVVLIGVLTCVLTCPDLVLTCPDLVLTCVLTCPDLTGGYCTKHHQNYSKTSRATSRVAREPSIICKGCLTMFFISRHYRVLDSRGFLCWAAVKK